MITGAKMKLKELIRGLKTVEVRGSLDKEIKDITADSNAVAKNGLFFCINGENYDGHRFAAQAERYGASAIVCETPQDVSVTQIVVKDCRTAMSVVAANFYGNPAKKMRLIGVTGTNGKTTVTHLITSVLMNAGIKCGLIGTLGVYYAGNYYEPSLTTPDPITLHKIFADMFEAGVEAVIMEVSAHASFYRKIEGLDFEVAVFTNLSHDHLDFFGDMENYKQAKLGFIASGKAKYVVTNADDETGREILSLVKGAVSYGMESPADVFAIDLSESVSHTDFILNLFDRIYRIRLELIGRFNVSNALAAATAAALFGVSTDKVAEGLQTLKGVGGRLENVYSGDFSVYVDYAHTPDGLLKTLSVLKPLCKGRLICVFGCGGNRDEKKRQIMGEISGELADFTVITSDNPRYEEPMDIISEIEKGVLKKTRSYVIAERREEAIEYALRYAKKGDVVLVAGKGCEKYQEIIGIKRLYNDKDTIEESLRALGVRKG